MILFAAAAVLLVISGIALLFSPFWGIIITFVAKPVIDTTWGAAFGGFKLLDVVGIMFPTLLLPRVLSSSELTGPPLRIRRLAYVYLASQTLGSLSLAFAGNFPMFAEVWFRSINGFLGFFLFSQFFRDAQGFKRLLIALIVAGLFPLFMGVYQNATGVMWREAMTVGLMRQIGLYHDAVSLRFFGLQSIASVLLYWSRVGVQKRVLDIALAAYVVGWIYVIFNLFSKAAVAILILWAATWLLLNRKVSYLIAAVLLVAVLTVSFGGPVLDTWNTLFSKELAYVSGDEEDARRLFAGRGYTWEYAWQTYSTLDAGSQLLGTGEMRGFHNEFLRVLYMNGAVGLCCFLAVLIYVGATLADSAFRRRSPLHIVALMVFQWYLVDCMGLHPGWYPAYQWFAWGIVGLALSS